MPDDSPGLFSNLTSFANAYLETKTRRLQNAKPQTKVDSGGSQNRVSFAGQDISRSDLKDIKEIRESGGIITSAYDAKALMRFGTGVEFHAENPDLEDWLRSNLPNIDLTVLEMGEDATYYPYYVGEGVENRVGGFSHIEHIEPWTMLPITDEYGDIVGWEQELSGTRETEQFTNEEIGHIVLNKSSGRDKTGISDVLQNKEEIETFRANQQAMRRATERLGYPFVHAKAGREGAAQLNDNELRRIRNRLADIGPGETQVTGPDVDIELKEGGTVDFGAIQERDTRMLSTAIGVPLEMLNEGSDGLGSGEPAKVRLNMFALQNEAARRRFAAQFKSEFLVDIVREYSPFDHTQEFGIHIKPFLDDKSDMAELIQKVGDYMTANEVRSKLDMEPLEDDEKGEAFRPPADEEAPEDEGGGLFGSAIDEKLDERDLTEANPRELQEEFEADVFELVATEEQEEFKTGARLGVGIDFPNSGVYVDWNIDAWPEDQRLDGPHVSEYATVEDAQTVAQGEVRELTMAGDTDFRDLQDVEDIALDELEAARENGAANLSIDTSKYEPWEAEYLDLHQRVFEAEQDRQLFNFTERAMPEFIKTRLRDVILSGEAVFNQFDTLDSDKLQEFRTQLADGLTQDGWTIDQITGRITDIDSAITRNQAETIARTEVASAVNTAREEGYEETGMAEGETFYWTGATQAEQPDRTTDACDWLIQETNPNHGGEPVSMGRLKELIKEAPTHDDDMDDNLARPNNFIVHPQERKTWVRAV